MDLVASVKESVTWLVEYEVIHSLDNIWFCQATYFYVAILRISHDQSY